MRTYLAGSVKNNPSPHTWRRAVKVVPSPSLEWVDPLEKYDASTGHDMEPEELIDHDLDLVSTCEAVLTYRVPSAETWGTVVETWEASQDGKFVVLVDPRGDVSDWAVGMSDHVVDSLQQGVGILEYTAEQRNRT